MASLRWGSAALAVLLLSVLLLCYVASADQDLNAAVAEKDDGGEAADLLLRLPSERSVPAEEGPNRVDEAVQLSAFGIDHQEDDGSSTGETTTVETEKSEPVTTEAPSLKVSLIPVRRDADGGLHRVHLTGGRGVFWFLHPRHHNRLFHRLFLNAAAPVEIHLGGGQHRAARMKILRRGLQMPLAMQMDQEEQEQDPGQQQQLPRVLTFRIRRLGPHHHGIMHNCAWRNRLEALGAAVQEEKGDERRPEGFKGLVKRFTVLLNPQRN